LNPDSRDQNPVSEPVGRPPTENREARNLPAAAGHSGVSSGRDANMRSCLDMMNTRHERRSPPRCRTPRRCGSSVCAPRAATTLSFDGTLTRSGRSRPITSTRRALSAADSGGGGFRLRRCSSSIRPIHAPRSRHACSSPAASRVAASCAGKARSGGADWMALILDHINGVPDDNRLSNLRIVCPNCAATFDTHCGRHNRVLPAVLECSRCGAGFVPQYSGQRHCSRRCGTRHANRRRLLASRRVERPPLTQLLAEIEATSFVAVGRRYGVSGNAIRKWVRAYEAQATDHDPP